MGEPPIGWDEILSDSLRGPIVVQAWRSHEKLFEAVHRGFGGILSAGWYLDHKLPAADLYRVEPARLRDVVEIVPDSARWKSWSIRIQAGAGVLDGRLTLFGPPERTTGALDLAGSVRPITSATASGDTMRLAVKSPEGAGTMVGVPRADSLRGTVGLFGFTLPFVGKRIGGSDMPGTVIPTFKTVPPLTPESEKRIVGGEAAMWSEVVSAGTIDSRIWPRAAAVAERLWSPASLTDDVDDMYRRLDHVSAFLTTRGVTHESAYPSALRELLGSDGDIAPLRTLVDALEEVKFYSAHGVQHGADERARAPQPRGRRTPREPNGAPVRGARGGVPLRHGASQRSAAIRAQLEIWRDNHARLSPMLASAKQEQDIRALSERLAAAATIGLAALDAIERRQPLRRPTSRATRAISPPRPRRARR